MRKLGPTVLAPAKQRRAPHTAPDARSGSLAGRNKLRAERTALFREPAMGRGRDGESPGSARDAPVDVFAQAEALNDLSKTYDVEIDGVPLQRMSTSELSKLAATRGLPLSHARGELIAAIARDELQSRANEKHPETRDGFERSSPSAPRGETPAPTNVVETYEDLNASDEEDEGSEQAAPESYLVGAASVVWEGELYTYGGLTPEGEFLTAVKRWSGRGASSEVAARAADPAVGAPPGRYGHSAVTVDDALYVFGGQGQFGCLDDLWRFDFVSCEWRLVAATGAPPAPRTNHRACVSDDVMFVFGGRDVRPGADVINYDDLYGFDLEAGEWLAIETRWRRPAGGDGCAMTSANGVLYVLSPSETCTEMLVWCLQLGAKNALRWTQVPRSGNVPSPRVDYATATYGHNWIVHGGRVLLRDGALGDTYAFHFPTAEWARFDPESDTDPRFGHCGSALDGALVLLHGTRDPHAAAYMADDAEEAKDAGECVAVDLTSYLPFPEFGAEKDEEDAFDAHRHGHLSTVEERAAAMASGNERTGRAEGGPGEAEEARGEEPEPDVAAFEREGFPKMNAKMLGKLNARGLGQKGGLMGGSLHVPRKGSHAPGDVELVSGTGRIKLHAHADVLAAASPGLKRLMQQRPVAAALARREDLVDRACKAFGGRSAALGQLLGVAVHLVHVLAVLATFAFRRALEAGGGKRRVTLVFPPETSTATLVAMLRWMYRIPLHPPLPSLPELHDAATRYEVKGLAAYCEQRLLQEMRADVAAGAARIAQEKHISGLWKAAARCARRDWSAVASSPGMTALSAARPDVAARFALAVHDTIKVEGR